jgi:hypothetical protein
VASSYQDDWLLKGGVLQEAQAWADGKNLSYLDQQFLAACEKKEIDEQIAVAEKQAELERERKDREAAERRNQALAEANRKVKRRIQIGAAVLIVAVLGAVVSGVLAGNTVIEANSKVEDANFKVAEANQRATDAEKREQNAQANEKRMQASAQQAAQRIQQVQARATEAEAREKDLKQKATEAGERLASAQQKAQQAAEQSQQAQKALSQAQPSTKAAELRVQTLKRETQQRTGEVQRAQNELQSAEKQRQEAQANLENARRGEEQAREQLAQAETTRQKVEADINNVSRLSKLAAQLQKQGLSAEANEALNQAGQFFNIEDEKIRQAMLFASMSLAYQQLGRQFKELKEQDRENEQWEEAEKSLQESQKNLEQLPSKVNLDDPKDWAIRVHVKRVQGSLLKKQGKTEEALKADTEAFDTLNAAWSKLPPVDPDTEIPIKEFLPAKQQILSANAVENLHREFLKLLSVSQANQQKVSDVKESLQAHFFAELNYLMKVSNWKDADIKTSDLMLNIAGKEQERYLNILDIENLSCPALRTIDKLWVKHSGGKFGFSVQKDILDSILGQPGRYDNLNEESWSEFVSRVGWGNPKLTYNLNKAERGNLPVAGWGWVGMGSGRQRVVKPLLGDLLPRSRNGVLFLSYCDF